MGGRFDHPLIQEGDMKEVLNVINSEMVTINLTNSDGESVSVEDIEKATYDFLKSNYDTIVRKVCTLAQCFVGHNPAGICDFTIGYICKALMETGGVNFSVTSRTVTLEEAKALSLKSIDDAIDKMKGFREQIEKGNQNESNTNTQQGLQK